MIAYGVYSPIYFITRKVPFYLKCYAAFQIYYFQLYLCLHLYPSTINVIECIILDVHYP